MNGAGTRDVATGGEHLDVLIVGAGLSGIGAAHHLQERCPGKSYAILEARADLGGTWDLFRYPGIRSDSDMHTLGYRFRPWTAAKSIADGESILEYVHATASEAGIDRHIRFHHRVVAAEWSSEEARWTVEAELADGTTVSLSCGFLFVNSGYYRYDQGYTPEFPGIEDFGGTVIHPQHWPEDADYAGKRVVVIGSGATAVTLVPAMAEEAARVTMLQRSPTYVVSLPGEDPLAKWLRRHLPDRIVYPLVRWKNVLIQLASYRFARKQPRLMKRLIRRGLVQALPEGYDVDTHFKPSYDPWDQRLCLVPDSDLFEAISSGTADVVTDRIKTFNTGGIELESGRSLEADVVVTATGLNLLFLGGMKIEVDGTEPDQAQLLAYKGMMLSDVPNLVFTIGYTNASWTLKADLVNEYVCRLLNHMEANGYERCMPVAPDPSSPTEPFIDLKSGYVTRALDQLPRQGVKAPWRLNQNYPLDVRLLRHGTLEDVGIEFSAGTPAAAEPRAEPALAV
ncbi:MAG TPA: NAD(P)/FAD-dependent oxidoreductase [Solirubrobacteraceae bacterium]|nr:NAD(P)/FAD-dependent oxidoreductase [Solirubrobacteraceae bacterium]